MCVLTPEAGGVETSIRNHGYRELPNTREEEEEEEEDKVTDEHHQGFKKGL